MMNRNRLNRFGTAWRAADFLRAALFFCGAVFFSHCMAVNVPEDYVSDLYYPASPGIASLTPSTSMSWTTLSVPVLVKFNKPMDTSTVTVNTTDTTCSGSIQITTAADNFATACLKFSSLTTTTRNSVFSAALTADLDPNSDYIIKVLGTVTDFQGKTLGADATYPFRSGIPSGSEPYVVSVTHPATPNGTFLVTVTFSRIMDSTTLANAYSVNDCSAPLLMANADLVSGCNTYINTPPDTSSNVISYAINYKSVPAGPFTFRISKTVRDKFGINMTADYSTVFP